MPTKPTGAILWSGPSEIDGEPVVLVAAALARSRNAKTGAMVQLYILRADVSPAEAVETGADRSICGDCRHRPRPGYVAPDGAVIPPRPRTCYVVLAHGPSSVWRGLQAGRYEHLDLESAGHLLAGRRVRVGAYGDPAAVPSSVWRELLTGARAWTGYSHGWRERPDLRGIAMASVDSASEADEARAAGWRTFRVRRAPEPLRTREVACPASAEAGRRTQCADCRLCAGVAVRAADIAIIAHGVGARAF